MNPDPTSLDRLHDLVLPPPVPWWPPAPVWYVIFALLALVLVRAFYRALARWQRHRYRREALEELAKHEAALLDPAQRRSALTALADLLKRTSITAFPREESAALTGAAWFSFLDRNCEGTKFAESVGAALEGTAYASRRGEALDEPQARETAAMVRRWITHHVDRAPEEAVA